MARAEGRETLGSTATIIYQTWRQVAKVARICNAGITCMRGPSARAVVGTTEAETAPLWRALADPTRRRILDLLLERPRITGEVAGYFHISRIAVMRHLTVLSDAGLIASRKRGRERRYYLNAITLQQIYRRWFDPLAAGWVSGILRLRAGVEASGTGVESPRPSVDIPSTPSSMDPIAPSSTRLPRTRGPGGVIR